MIFEGLIILLWIWWQNFFQLLLIILRLHYFLQYSTLSFIFLYKGGGNNLAAEYIAVALTLSQNRCNSARKNVRSKWRVDFFLWWKSPQNWNIGIWISPAISHVNSVLNNVLHPLKSWIFSPFFRQKHVGQQSILSLFHVNFGGTFTGGKNCFVTHSVHSF